MMYSIRQTAKMLNVWPGKIERLTLRGKIPSENLLISQNVLDQLLFERNNYISFLEYAKLHVSETFNGNSSRERRKLLTILEKNDFFGIERIFYSKTLLGEENDIYFFDKKDIPKLDNIFNDFFTAPNLSTTEQYTKVIEDCPDTKQSKKEVLEFTDSLFYEKNMTISYVDFAKTLLNAPDLQKLTNNDVQVMLKSLKTELSKKYLIQFLNMMKQKYNLKYSPLEVVKKEKNSVKAYDAETYVALAKCFFNIDYIYEHNMIEKALNNHIFAEMWLYLTLFFVCGWRASDVCNGWKYLELYRRPEDTFGIHQATLYDDLLNDNIPEDVYENVCLYAIGSIDISGKMPSKTAKYNPTTLTAVITPEMYIFYGLLTLIAECHKINSGDGYMKDERRLDYQAIGSLKMFFGKEIGVILNNRNIHSRRLNKDYLQAVEQNARQNGASSMMSSMVASYARNHKDINTIATYLKDHNLNGETADMVLYFMMERGVFGFELYQTIITAFPDAMKKLSLKEQNKIIQQMNITPFQNELEQSGLIASVEVKDNFLKNNTQQTMNLLKSMFEISQGCGKSKDDGVGCLMRSQGKVCPYAEFKSCIANACPYLVFTKYGFKALLEVLQEYMTESKNGNRKADAILKSIILPRFKDILNSFMNEQHMSHDDRQGLKLFMKNTLEEG